MAETTLKSPGMVDHPLHYGGADNPYEAIKVIEAWELGFRLGNAVKYIARAGRKYSTIEDLKKARWYLDREIEQLEAPITAAHVEKSVIDHAEAFLQAWTTGDDEALPDRAIELGRALRDAGKDWSGQQSTLDRIT